MKRIVLFIATNLAVMLVLSIVLSLLGIGRPGAGGRNPADFVVVGQRPDVDAGLARVGGHGGGSENAVGDIGMAVQINF